MEKLKNNDFDYMLVIVPYIAEIIAADMPDKVRELRFDAIMQLKSRLAFYKERGYMDKLLCAVARKRAEMIMRTTSKTEMEKVMSVRCPHYDGNKFVPDAYNVPEEEMIAWAETSFMGPLNDIGYERYKELFGQLFPEQAKQIFN